MGGFWSGTVTTPLGQDEVDFDLRTNGKLHYWQTGKFPFEATGSWGYERKQFLYQFTRVRQGVGPHTKNVFFLFVRHLDDHTLVLGYEHMQFDLKKR